MASRKSQSRVEKDALGEIAIPAGCSWGTGTARCLEYFDRAGSRTHWQLVEALASVKKAAAQTNRDLDLIDSAAADAIIGACDEVLDGKWREQFEIGAIHGGMGVGLIVNTGEVIQARAGEILSTRGDSGSIDLALVNLNQSLSDVYITAMRVAVLQSLRTFEPTLLELERLLRRKSLEFERIVKPSRTVLRNSVPVTLGQEFNSYGSAVEKASLRIKERAEGLSEINLGGGAVGTGFNTDQRFAYLAANRLADNTRLPLRASDDYFRTTLSMGDFVSFSSTLKELAVELLKIAADLRLLSSDLASRAPELSFPRLLMQPSDLLPGVMPDIDIPPMTEQLSMLCFAVMGNDHAVTLAGQAGLLESNSMTPVIIDSILRSLELLEGGMSAFSRHCLSRMSADPDGCGDSFSRSAAAVAALSTEFGYERALELVKEAAEKRVDVKKLLLDAKLIPRAALDRLFHHSLLTTPGSVRAAAPAEDTRNDTN